MQATPVRVRLGSAFEWLIAALFLMATVGVATLIIRELRMAPPAVVAAQPAAVATVPAGVPARAISVPVLLLLDGHQIRVGDTAEDVAKALGRNAEVGRQVADRGVLGERLTRFYEHGGTRFVLVFEPFERNGALRVAGIYLQ
jgi:hypothetical protein